VASPQWAPGRAPTCKLGWTGDLGDEHEEADDVDSRARLDAEAIRPPSGGRAPGWHAGLVVARREQVHASGVRTITR